MPILDNPKRERFAQALASGKTADEAYEAAGYRPNRQNAHRMTTNDDVSARVAELLARGAERAEITVEKVLREMAKIGFSDIRKLVSWRSNVTVIGTDPDTEGDQTRAFNEVQLVDSHVIDDDTAAAIAEVSQSKEGALKVKMYSKLEALEKIGKHLGMFVDRTEVGQPGEFDDLDAKAKRERVVSMVKRLGLSRADRLLDPPEGNA